MKRCVWGEGGGREGVCGGREEGGREEGGRGCVERGHVKYSSVNK